MIPPLFPYVFSKVTEYSTTHFPFHLNRKMGIFISFVKALSGYKKVMTKKQTLHILIFISQTSFPS